MNTLPPGLAPASLSVPVIGAPMFIVSGPELVIAQCLAGTIGAFPALNARPAEQLDSWLTHIEARLQTARTADPARRIGAHAVNLIVHPDNARLAQDLDTCVRHRVPLVITSLSAPGAVVSAVHGYGGKVFHDVISLRHAQKALEAGVDGLILVATGAGGHAGTLSPFALVREVRRLFDGPIALSGAMATGQDVLAARAMGADYAYIGTRFIATAEAAASVAYKHALIEASAADIVYSPYFTGVHGNYLRASIVAAGLDPAALPQREGGLRLDTAIKAWKDIWGAGQGVGSIDDLPQTAELVARLAQQYRHALAALCAAPPI